MRSHTTVDELAPAAGTGADRNEERMTAAGLMRIVRRLLKPMMRAHLRRQAVQELSSLPGPLLRDIGMRPEDIHEVADDLARERVDAWARQARGSNGFGG